MSVPYRRSLARCPAIVILPALIFAALAASAITFGQDAVDHRATPVFAAATPDGQVFPPQVDEDDDDDKSSKLIRGHLIQPLGWVSALLMVSASLYYSAKRSVLVAVQAAEGPQRRLIGSELRRALDRHIAASLAAIAIAFLHLSNFFGNIRLTSGWLTLVLMLAVAASGVFGRFFTGAPGVRKNWRRFHLPLTYAFFAVLALHIVQTIELFED